MDQLILERAGFPRFVQSIPPMSARPWRWLGLAFAYARTWHCVRSCYRVRRPSIVVGTGGLGSFAGVLAAARMRIPTAVLNPDALPGRANRFLLPRVDCVFTQWPAEREDFRGCPRVLAVGCPTRESFGHATRADGIRCFGLDPARKTLLVTGASQGARSINRAVVGNLPFVRSLANWQILHLTGHADYEAVGAAYRKDGTPGHILPFSDRMDAALACADLVVARAGASTLGEITAVGRASILLPYPYHRDEHQLANARKLERAPGGPAAMIVMDAREDAVNTAGVREALEALMKDDLRRSAMAKSAAALGRPEAGAQVASALGSMMEDSHEGRACELLQADALAAR